MNLKIIDVVVGVLRKQDLLDLHLDGKLPQGSGEGSAALLTAVREPLVVHDGSTILQVLEIFKNRPIQMALIVDEYGAVRGESKSLLKNTNAEQAQRFARINGDLYDELPPFDDMPY